jgi:hypothetical protein
LGLLVYGYGAAIHLSNDPHYQSRRLTLLRSLIAATVWRLFALDDPQPMISMSIGKLTDKEVILLYDAKHRLVCRYCMAKFLDPDKTKHQIYLSDRCPACGVHPDEERTRLKQEKRARKQANRHHIKHQNRNKSKRR